MTIKPRFVPMPETATDAALEMALKPFVERFVKEEKRERASSLLFGRTSAAPGSSARQPRVECRDLLPLIDTKRGRTYTDPDLAPWHAVRGIFLVDKDVFSVDAKTALGLYVRDPWIFIAYTATFAVAHWEVGQSLLLT